MQKQLFEVINCHTLRILRRKKAAKTKQIIFYIKLYALKQRLFTALSCIVWYFALCACGKFKKILSAIKSSELPSMDNNKNLGLRVPYLSSRQFFLKILHVFLPFIIDSVDVICCASEYIMIMFLLVMCKI